MSGRRVTGGGADMNQEVPAPAAQIAMVLDLNKCLGCHTCTIACKKLWNTDQGTDYAYWNNVETMPGRGYPRGIFTPELGGGFVNPTGDPTDGNWQVKSDGPLPSIHADYGDPWEYNYDEVLKTEGGAATSSQLVPFPSPDGPNAYASNWDEDVGGWVDVVLPP